MLQLNDLLCEGLNLCPKAYMNNWRIFPVTEIPFLLHKHAVGFGVLKLFICWTSYKNPTKDLELSKRCRCGSQRMVVWLAFSEHVLWFVDALAHLHLFIGIYSHSLIGRIEWISGNDLWHAVQVFFSGNDPRLIGVTLAILSLAYFSLAVNQRLILFTIWAVLLLAILV